MLRCFQSFVLVIWFIESAGFTHARQRFSLRRIPNSISSARSTKLHFLIGMDFDVPNLIANFISPALEVTEQVDSNGLATEPDFFTNFLGDARDLAFLVAGVAFIRTLPVDVEEDSVADAANADRAPASCPQCQGSGNIFGGKCDLCYGTGKLDYNNPSFQLPGATRHVRKGDRRVVIDNDDDDDDIDPTNGKGWFRAIFDDDDDDDEEEDVKIISKAEDYGADEEYADEDDKEKESDDTNNSSNNYQQQQNKKQSKWFDNDEI